MAQKNPMQLEPLPFKDYCAFSSWQTLATLALLPVRARQHVRYSANGNCPPVAAEHDADEHFMQTTSCLSTWLPGVFYQLRHTTLHHICTPPGSDGARLHVEGVRARVMTTAAAAAKAKFGTTEAEFNTVAELLGTDADDEDFCPTCLEAYTDGACAAELLPDVWRG